LTAAPKGKPAGMADFSTDSPPCGKTALRFPVFPPSGYYRVPMQSLRLPLLLSLLLPTLAAAERVEEGQTPVQTNLHDSVRRVEQETGGRVLRVEPVRRGGQDTYRMKVLTPEGRVRVMQDDHPHPRRETSGRVLQQDRRRDARPDGFRPQPAPQREPTENYRDD